MTQLHHVNFAGVLEYVIYIYTKQREVLVDDLIDWYRVEVGQQSPLDGLNTQRRFELVGIDASRFKPWRHFPPAV